ncbi:CLIP domain-containing serine protease B4-like [Ochlerotatus camptorhynchus]|uniref:CLIP domain-containing serine protease B4-like n=1 Tax=Ochlerotatus camptorhynchus TaxID=644619 RepID=UPI0031DAC38C
MITTGTIIALLSTVIAMALAAKCSLPAPGVCGIRALKEIEEPFYPWTAVLIVQPQWNGPIVAICGGTLISDRFVLTPAHCFENLPGYVTFKIRLGGWNITSERACDAELCAGRIIDVAIVSHVIHQDFNSSHIQHDIAMIKLARPVTFTNFISPICLPWSESHMNPLESGRILRVVGWNIVEENYIPNVTDFIGDRHQNSMEVRTVSDEECDFDFQSTSEICTEQVDENNLQRVDFARSLVTQERDDYWYQHGHGVWEFGNPKQHESDIFTRITHYLDWIRENLNGAGPC